jgi:hypothetical protein
LAGFFAALANFILLSVMSRIGSRGYCSPTFLLTTR